MRKEVPRLQSEGGLVVGLVWGFDEVEGAAVLNAEVLNGRSQLRGDAHLAAVSAAVA